MINSFGPPPLLAPSSSAARTNHVTCPNPWTCLCTFVPDWGKGNRARQPLALARSKRSPRTIRRSDGARSLDLEVISSVCLLRDVWEFEETRWLDWIDIDGKGI